MKILQRLQALRSAAQRSPLHVVIWTTSLLAACGGGGAERPTLGGEVRGLTANGVLELSVNGSSQSFTTSVFTEKIDISFSRSFSAGDSYAITVQKHPQGQICAVLRSASGTLNASVRNVLVECHTTRLNDTGVQGTTAAEISALAPDSLNGRDAEASRLTKVGSGVFGFDYSKICPSGEMVDSQGGCPASANWACVRDNVTGLMWRRSDVTYGGSVPPTLGSESLCGRTNWRAPTVHELLSTVHAGKAAAPYADTDYFDFSSSGRVFLSAESYRGVVNTSWVVDFGNAGASGSFTNGNPEVRRARWVSGTSALDDPNSSAYSKRDVDANYVIIDTSRELMWLVPKSLGQGTWSAAVAEVAAVNAALPGTYGDWRLPNRSELDALVNRSLDRPAMDPVVAAAIPNSNDASVIYWSSSTYSRNTNRAWVVDFSFGDITEQDKTGQARFIYVRNRAFNNPP